VRKDAAKTEAKSSTRNNAAEKNGKSAASTTSAECAQIYQRLSLGETRRDLIERAKALNCP
jgi:hypothetical protein